MPRKKTIPFGKLRFMRVRCAGVGVLLLQYLVRISAGTHGWFVVLFPGLIPSRNLNDDTINAVTVYRYCGSTVC